MWAAFERMPRARTHAHELPSANRMRCSHSALKYARRGAACAPPSELRASACSFDAQAFGMPPFARCVRTRSHLPAGASAQSCLLALVSGRPSDRQSDGVPGELGARATSFDAHAGEQHLGGLRAHLHSLATRLTAYANGQPVCVHGAGCPAPAHQQAGDPGELATQGDSMSAGGHVRVRRWCRCVGRSCVCLYRSIFDDRSS